MSKLKSSPHTLAMHCTEYVDPIKSCLWTYVLWHQFVPNCMQVKPPSAVTPPGLCSLCSVLCVYAMYSKHALAFTGSNHFAIVVCLLIKCPLEPACVFPITAHKQGLIN